LSGTSVKTVAFADGIAVVAGDKIAAALNLDPDFAAGGAAFYLGGVAVMEITESA
jgi:hypothetical protein